MIKVADENIYSSDEEKLISNKNDEKPVRYLNKINNWLSEKAFFDMKYRLNCEVMQCIDIGDFGPSYTIYPQYVGRLLVVDKAGRSLRFSDVGTGVAQVIPILIDLALDKALLYRQPEVHLHPKLQTKIADCFVQQVNTNKGNREFKIRLIETHSEHFVLRIIRRLKDSFKDELLHSSLTVYSEDFSLLYFKPFDDYSEIHEIRVSEDGAFIDAWPDGFFDDSDDDLWRILS